MPDHPMYEAAFGQGVEALERAAAVLVATGRAPEAWTLRGIVEGLQLYAGAGASPTALVAPTEFREDFESGFNAIANLYDNPNPVIRARAAERPDLVR